MSIARTKAQRIFDRDGNKCKACGASYRPTWDVPWNDNRGVRDCLVIDHVVPGAGNDESNLQTLCWSCNSAKGGRSQAAFDLYLAVKMLGRPVCFYPSIATVVGMKQSLFLCQLIYWTPRSRNDRGDGWIYKSADEMQSETGLTYKEQIHARECLTMLGILEEKYERSTHRMYFRVNPTCLAKVLGPDNSSDGYMTNRQVPPPRLSGATCQKVRWNKGTEITTETTTEITNTTRIRERHSNSGKQLHFSGTKLRITTEEHQVFTKAFEGTDLAAEYLKMDSWLVANHRNYRAFGRFANTWLSRVKIPHLGGSNGESAHLARTKRTLETARRMLESANGRAGEISLTLSPGTN